MPLLDHVDSVHPPRTRRLAIPIDTVYVLLTAYQCVADLGHLVFQSGNPPHSLLSPIVSHFSSLSSIPNLKGFFPTSPNAPQIPLNGLPAPPEPGKAVWQEGDLGDGQGVRPLLFVMSSVNALQIFTAPRPPSHDDSQAAQPIRPPEEVFVIPAIKYGSKTHTSSLQSPTASSTAPKHATQTSREKVLSALMLDNQRVVLVTQTSGKKSALALVLMDLGSDVARKRVELGPGSAADIQGSSRMIVVAISHPTPSLHFLDPLSLESTRPAITNLPTNSQSQLPAFSISGRLLAHVVSSPPAPSLPRSTETLITSSSISAARQSQRIPSSTRSPADGAQGGALLNSAVEIGGGVARGVWAGIKLGARAASDAAARSRSDRLAKSAPATTVAELGGDADDFEGVESKSLDGESLFGSQMEADRLVSSSEDGHWVKVVDIYPRAGSRGIESLSGSVTGQAPEETIAHFRLPPSSGLPLEAPQPPNPPHPAVSQVSFSRCGTQLLVAPADGRSFHIVELHPAGITDVAAGREPKNQIWHLYELKRGHTIATADNIQWDRSGRWVGVGTGKGTVHIFPIHPCGGPPLPATHTSRTVTNPQQIYPLSTLVSPIARLRPSRPMGDASNPDRLPEKLSPGQPVFTFLPHGPTLTTRDSYVNNVAIYRPRLGVLEYARLYTRKRSQGTNSVEAEHHSQRASSALTDMMRNRSSGHYDLVVEKDIRGRWSLPGATSESVLLNTASARPSASMRRSRASRMGSLSAAEIRTHHPSPRILPNSIYLSRQAEFYSARPIDDYSPLSILDLEARTRKLHFRHEVEARSPSNESVEKMSVSFKEPLLSALHEIIESPPDRQIPGLPNGYAGAGGTWGAVPMRTVKAGLNEGVGRMRREYARAQYARERRKADQAERTREDSTGLSFEDDAVFAAYEKDSEEDGTAPESKPSRSPSASPSASISASVSTPPSSSGPPPLKAELSDGESGWGDKWEEEYKRAVEEDGGPDDLVLGLMDEEEDERRT